MLELWVWILLELLLSIGSGWFSLVRCLVERSLFHSGDSKVRTLMLYPHIVRWSRRCCVHMSMSVSSTIRDSSFGEEMSGDACGLRLWEFEKVSLWLETHRSKKITNAIGVTSLAVSVHQDPSSVKLVAQFSLLGLGELLFEGDAVDELSQSYPWWILILPRLDLSAHVLLEWVLPFSMIGSVHSTGIGELHSISINQLRSKHFLLFVRRLDEGSVASLASFLELLELRWVVSLVGWWRGE